MTNNFFALTQLLAPFDYPCDRYFKLYDEGKKQPEYIEMSLKYKVINNLIVQTWTELPSVEYSEYIEPYSTT